MTRYKIIYADPPWEYDNQQNNLSSRGGSSYGKLSLAELQKLPVKDIADKDSLLYLWVTEPKAIEGLETLKAWGFTHITTAFVWIKLNQSGKYREFRIGGRKYSTIENILTDTEEIVLDGGCYSGMGYYTNSNIERVIIGKRGKGVPRINKSVKQLVFAPIKRHSEKPAEVRDRIVKLHGDVPRIELFSRHNIPGWKMVGDQIDKTDIRDTLPMIINGTI